MTSPINYIIVNNSLTQNPLLWNSISNTSTMENKKTVTLRSRLLNSNPSNIEDLHSYIARAMRDGATHFQGFVDRGVPTLILTKELSEYDIISNEIKEYEDTIEKLKGKLRVIDAEAKAQKEATKLI